MDGAWTPTETALCAVLVHRKTPASGDVGTMRTVVVAAVSVAVMGAVTSCPRSSCGGQQKATSSLCATDGPLMLGRVVRTYFSGQIGTLWAAKRDGLKAGRLVTPSR